MDVAIVDYGMGNLFSVQHACEWAGMNAVVTGKAADLEHARAVILPGVGAFGEAMATLTELGMPDALRAVAASGRPLMGICLGLQLLMEQSHEFGEHRGLGLIAGDVVKLDSAHQKVPHVGWSAVQRPHGVGWQGGPLDALADGAPMYFVHSYFVRPRDRAHVLAEAEHGGQRFCAAVQHGNVFACQFHPERSGPEGLRVYRTLARRIGV